MSNLTHEDVQQLAREAVEIMQGRIVNAVRYSEAYEATDCTVVLHANHLAPSLRALPNGERVWSASFDQDSPELWETFVDGTDAIEAIEVPDGRTDSDEPDVWVISWEDGDLWAYAPEHEQRD
jgi:hypothetical protein